MKTGPRRLLLLAILGTSLALNLAFVADHVRRGTFRRVFVRMDMVEATVDRSAYQREMEARHRKLADESGGVVFAGDSLVFQGPWAEFYSDIHNRGIPNETSALLLGRLGEALRGHPRKLVLLTGANDFIQGVPVAQLLRNYRSILEKVRADSPETEIAIIGVIPVNPTVSDAPRYDNPAVLEANRRLEALAREFAGTRFLDLMPRLADDSGKLRREFTEDGIHLNLDGYLTIRESVRNLIDEPGRPKAELTESAVPADRPPDRR